MEKCKIGNVLTIHIYFLNKGCADMKNEKGFTLVEVLASIVIILALLLSFSSIFISNNKYANLNTEKLVVVNLADAQLERIRVMATKLDSNISFPDIEINGKSYKVIVTSSQTESEEKMNIQNVVVKVSAIENNASTTVEGYVVYEEIE